jgi:hypothetical protein
MKIYWELREIATDELVRDYDDINELLKDRKVSQYGVKIDVEELIKEAFERGFQDGRVAKRNEIEDEYEYDSWLDNGGEDYKEEDNPFKPKTIISVGFPRWFGDKGDDENVI